MPEPGAHAGPGWLPTHGAGLGERARGASVIDECFRPASRRVAAPVRVRRGAPTQIAACSAASGGGSWRLLRGWHCNARCRRVVGKPRLAFGFFLPSYTTAASRIVRCCMPRPRDASAHARPESRVCECAFFAPLAAPCPPRSVHVSATVVLEDVVISAFGPCFPILVVSLSACHLSHLSDGSAPRARSVCASLTPLFSLSVAGECPGVIPIPGGVVVGESRAHVPARCDAVARFAADAANIRLAAGAVFRVHDGAGSRS